MSRACDRAPARARLPSGQRESRDRCPSTPCLPAAPSGSRVPWRRHLLTRWHSSPWAWPSWTASLYAIDRLVHRAVSRGLITVMLAGVCAGTVALVGSRGGYVSRPASMLSGPARPRLSRLPATGSRRACSATAGTGSTVGAKQEEVHDSQGDGERDPRRRHDQVASGHLIRSNCQYRHCKYTRRWCRAREAGMVTVWKRPTG